MALASLLLAATTSSWTALQSFGFLATTTSATQAGAKSRVMHGTFHKLPLTALAATSGMVALGQTWALNSPSWVPLANVPYNRLARRLHRLLHRR